MTDTVELARRPGVELIRTGSFQTLTGSWNPTPADIQAAIEAMECPAIRKPVIRLGHTDKRFGGDVVSGDGEPAMGWFENLRAADGGKTLVADQVTLPWLHSVQAAAYPSRSIEGNYNHRCSEGHIHPFVIHTVALLGVTPPGVSTLRSLNDLPAMLGVAATGEVPDGARQVEVTIMAAAEVHTGAMIALVPSVEDAARLAVDGGEPADDLHLTLAYLGDAAGLGATGQQDVIDAVSAVVNGLPTVEADGFALSAFNPGNVSDRDTCIVLGLSGDILDAVHNIVDQALTPEQVAQQHRPWAAHTTLIYTDDVARIAELSDRIGPVLYDRVRLAFGPQIIDIPLIGTDEQAPDYDEPELVAAAGDDDQLKKYWLLGDGLKKWADKPHPWTALYRALLPHLKNPEKAKRIASAWYREHFGHTPNQKGVKAAEVLAGRHSLPDFEEAKHKRARDGKFATKWGGDGLKQGGKLDSRIQLGPHETLAGGASFPQSGIVLAAIDSPDGRKLRLGLNIPEEDLGRWSGADKGHTVVLDQAGVDGLQDAVTRMLDGAVQGKAALKEFQKRETSLHGQEQALLGKQYPGLTAKQSKELGVVNRDLTASQEDLRTYLGRQQDRLDAIPDRSARDQAHTLDAEIAAARAAGDSAARADAEKRMQALLVEHGEHGSITSAMYARTNGQITGARARTSQLQDVLAGLTANPVELSDTDRAALVKVRADLAANDDLWTDFNDGSSLAAGVVPGDWGDIRWQATMSSDEPAFSLAVVPKDAGDGFVVDSDEGVQAADLKKLAALLDKVGADPDVKAAADPDPTTAQPATHNPAATDPLVPNTSELPAAEPEPINTDPKEDLVSTDLSEHRSRLGLDDTADAEAMLAAYADRLTKAETPVEPTPEMVAASAAVEAEKTELRKEVEVLASQVQTMSSKLAEAEASKAATVKASVFDAAVKDGKIKPAERETWERDYDEAPAAVTRVLASIAVGSAVPVMASGVAGSPDPLVGDDEWDSLTALLDGPKAV